MLERKQYAKPPLLEVFCEILFAPPNTQEWDGLLLTDFYDSLGRDRFPRKTGLPGVRVASPHIQFLTPSGNTIVQVGENVLVVNQSPPEYAWEKFEQETLTALAHYLGVWKPQTIRRAGLHYVNRVEVPGETINLPDWFNLHSVLPAAFQDRPVGNLAMAFEVAGAREGDILSIGFQQQPSANPELNPIHLQWNYITARSVDASPEEVQAWLAVAHDAASLAFRASITLRCEALFGTVRGIDP